MRSPRHLWSGDWRIDAATVAEELAKHRVANEEPAERRPAHERLARVRPAEYR
jgi:hypothetical protein